MDATEIIHERKRYGRFRVLPPAPLVGAALWAGAAWLAWGAPMAWSQEAETSVGAVLAPDAPVPPVAPDTQDWLDARSVRELLTQENARAWREEARQVDIRSGGGPSGGAGAAVLPQASHETTAARGSLRQASAAMSAADEERSSRPQVRAIYGTGRFRVAEVEINGGRHVFSSDATGRLPPQTAAGYRLVSIHGRCVGLRKHGVVSQSCWNGDSNEAR